MDRLGRNAERRARRGERAGTPLIVGLTLEIVTTSRTVESKLGERIRVEDVPGPFEAGAFAPEYRWSG